MMYYVSLSVFIILFFCLTKANYNHNYNYDISTLKLVHVVMRHGNSTIDRSYPTDPYINETYYPFGLGELTNKGKLQAYRIGLALRLRYDNFIEDEYVPGVLEAVSTNTNRTKTSLELLLFALYQAQNVHSNYTKIPYTTYLSPNNHTLPVSFTHCNKFNELYEEFHKSSTGLDRINQSKSLYEYLSQKTGLNITNPRNLLALTTTLEAQEDWGYTLPSWTESIWPNFLKRDSGEEFFISTFTPELGQLSGGFLLKKIIEDTRAKLENTLIPNNRKLYIYSGHDTNLGNLMGVLGILYHHCPPYSAYLLIEVHTIDNVDGIKIFYQDYHSTELIAQWLIPECASFCPFTEFFDLLKNKIPNDDNACEV